MRLLFLALLLCFATAQAGDLSLSVPVQPGSGVRISITSWLRQRPSIGFMPLKVTIQNNMSGAGTWELSRDDKRGGRSIYFSQNLEVPAKSERTFDVMLPIGAGGTSTYYDQFRFDGPGVSARVNLPMDTSGGSISAYSRYFALSESLHKTSWSDFTSSASSGRPIIGSAVDPVTAPTDWRGYTGLTQWWMTRNDWQNIPAASKTALLEWIALGGEVAVVCPGSDPSSVDSMPLPPGKGTVRRHGSGRVVAVFSGTADRPDRATINNLVSYGDYVEFENACARFQTGTWSQDIVGELKLRGWLIFLFIVVFAIIVGPVNLFVLANKGKRARLFWTTPLISLVGSIVLALLILFQDGTGGAGVQLIHVDLLPADKKMAITQEQTCRTGLLLGSSFAIAEPNWMQPMDGRAIADSPKQRIPNGQTDTQESWHSTPDTRSGDWFRSRALQSHMLKAIRSSRAGIELTAGAIPSVVSSIDSDLKVLYVVDSDGKVWTAEGLATGEKRELTASSKEALNSWLISIRTEAKPGEILSHGILDGDLLNGWIYAEAGDAKSFAIQTLDSIHWKARRAFITGPYIPRQ
ncbi:MAG: hypothetical protein H7A55_01590 [Verrucomicrobiaceae bacterium]|nr:hypothetical protein [Verrucomicrobiaceae bacterium]